MIETLEVELSGEASLSIESKHYLYFYPAIYLSLYLAQLVTCYVLLIPPYCDLSCCHWAPLPITLGFLRAYLGFLGELMRRG